MDNQNNFPYHFNNNTCKKCDGKCCRGFAGYIWISMEKLEKMAGARKMDVALFSKQYVRQVQGNLSLQEHVINGEHDMPPLFVPLLMLVQPAEIG